MRLAHWTLALVLGGLLPASAPAQASTAADRTALLQQIQRLGDNAPSRLFFQIAEGADAESFATLKDALDAVSDPGTARAAYGACALFKGTAIQSPAIQWLSHRCFKARRSSHQVGAAQALTYFWQDAQEELLRVVRSHSSRECRQAALPAVVPALTREGGRQACLTLIQNAEGMAGGRTLLLAALRNFTTTEEETTIANALRSKKTPRSIKLVLVDALAARDTKIARTAIERRLEDSDEVVRLRALKWLASQGDAEQLKRLRPVAMSGSPDFVVDAMLTLAKRREGDPAWVSELYSFTLSQDKGVRLGAAKALGRIHTRDALGLLHRLLKDSDLDVRLTALDQVESHHQLESVPRLIAALGAPRDLFTHEVALALRLLTGEDNGTSRTRWSAWFDDVGATLQLPTLEESARRERERDTRRLGGQGTTASFYGMEVSSRKVYFVVDTSGSMDDPASGRGTTSSSGHTTRMEVAKRELKNTLNQLLNGVEFNLITFASKVNSYDKELIRLSPASRERALSAVDKWTADGGTALYNGLRRALFDPEVEAVYLLTDGVPTEGEVIAEGEIRARVRELIEGRDIRIHGIAIGQASSLLKGLAKDSGGQYTQIL